jgi:hypothetical protein
VAEYRAYLVGMSGHFVGFEPLVCADDTEATEKAERFVDGHDIEVWSGPRFVTKLTHTRKYASEIWEVDRSRQ